MTDLDEIERLLAKATPGPWSFGRGKSGLSVAAIAGEKKEVASSSWHSCSDLYPTERETVANFEALTALRNAAPAMIAELKALREVLNDPSDAMIEAGEEAIIDRRQTGSRIFAADIWDAMAQCALHDISTNTAGEYGEVEACVSGWEVDNATE